MASRPAPPHLCDSTGRRGETNEGVKDHGEKTMAIIHRIHPLDSRGGRHKSNATRRKRAKDGKGSSFKDVGQQIQTLLFLSFSTLVCDISGWAGWVWKLFPKIIQKWSGFFLRECFTRGEEKVNGPLRGIGSVEWRWRYSILWYNWTTKTSTPFRCRGLLFFDSDSNLLNFRQIVYCFFYFFFSRVKIA